MHIKFWILFLLSLWISTSFANWHSLGKGFNNYVQTIYIDTSNSKIYAGGPFNEADSIRTMGIAVWNSSSWDSLGNGLVYNQFNFNITKYQNQIYSDGGFVGNNIYQHGGKFNGSTWDTLGYGALGFIRQFKEINGTLWAASSFIHNGSDTCSLLATWTGSEWNCFNVPYYNYIEDFLMFDGSLIIGGNFFDSTSRVGIAYYDGNQFQIMGHRIGGSFATVHSLAVYQGELYIGGYFTQSDGNEGNHIMKWNGAQWEDVGGGMDNWIECMQVYNDELYVGGAFNYAGGVHTGNLAKWNGIHWMPVTSTFISPIIYDIQFFNGELYIGGGFTNIDSLQVNHIARYDGPLTTGDFSKPLHNFYLFPNPSYSSISISFYIPLSEDAILSGTDVMGKKQFQVFIPSQTAKKEIDISELSSGIYFLTLFSESGSITRKMVKQ